MSSELFSVHEGREPVFINISASLPPSVLCEIVDQPSDCVISIQATVSNSQDISCPKGPSLNQLVFTADDISASCSPRLSTENWDTILKVSAVVDSKVDGSRDVEVTLMPFIGDYPAADLAKTITVSSNCVFVVFII